METVCPLDIEFKDQIAALLALPSPESVQDYFDQLLATRRHHGLKIKQSGEFGKAVVEMQFEKKMKGLFSNSGGEYMSADFLEINRGKRNDPSTLMPSHTSTKWNCGKETATSHGNNKYIVERIWGTKSFWGVYVDTKFKEGELILKDQILVGAQHISNKVDSFVCSYCFHYIGSIEVQIGRKLYLQGLGVEVDEELDHATLAHTSKEVCAFELLGEGESKTFMANHDNLESCASSESKENTFLPKEVIESLINDELSLPYSKQFPLPPVTSCLGGCEEEHYCSKSCAEADWELFHSLLCTGKVSSPPRREALARFVEHATGTNDIFLLAAKVISSTILKYEKLKAAQLADLERHAQANMMNNFTFSLLLEAWKPISMGFKKSDLVVASPVEDYFLYIDDLPYLEKEKTEKLIRPFLDALGDDYSVCCQGTAFFPIQSCMNHSCCPNAKAFKRDEDRDGQATIIALRSISNGEEITISYIDEDLPYQERQALLADYGFRCKCPKCVLEEHHP